MAVFRPAANTVPLVATHFAERMGTERFCLLDPTRGVAALHGRASAAARLCGWTPSWPLGWSRSCALPRTSPTCAPSGSASTTDLPSRGAVPYERGYDLRTHWMPKRLWEGLVELDPALGRQAHVPARYAGRQSA